jgi:hypothetical protein
MKLPAAFFSLALACGASAQTLDQAMAEATKQGVQAGQAAVQSAASNASPGTPSAGGEAASPGGSLPFFDPGSEILSWDGKMWKVTNNRIFRARFEKYLNAPETNPADSALYEEKLEQILYKLTPARGRALDVSAAWALLPEAAAHPLDARLCDALAAAVYNVWAAQRQDANLARANQALERARESTSWNAQQSVENSRLGLNPPKDEKAAAEWMQEQQMRRSLRMQPYLTRLAELEAMMKANQVKREVSELQSKIEFQSLILQFFFQRRFRHVLLGAAFYRGLFSDGDGKLRVGSEAEQMIQKYSGVPPTLSVLESLALEAIQDVRQGVESYHFLLEKQELAAAADRLAEAFAAGENLREIRDLSRDDKRRCLAFIQQSNQLLSALEVKDYTRAEELVTELRATAKDFDPSKPLGAIQTARTLSGMLLDKARTAALSGDRATFEQELKAATEIWPRNPKLVELSSTIFSQADVQQQAVIDFDRLLSQKNHRQIFEDKVRFIVATANYPDRAKQLAAVLEDMQKIEGSIIRAQEAAKMGDHRGAWETIERAIEAHPQDPRLIELRSEYATEAADYVRALRNARQLEQRGQLGSSFSWYLKAQDAYPPSEFAREGLNRLVEQAMASTLPPSPPEPTTAAPAAP